MTNRWYLIMTLLCAIGFTVLWNVYWQSRHATINRDIQQAIAEYSMRRPDTNVAVAQPYRRYEIVQASHNLLMRGATGSQVQPILILLDTETGRTWKFTAAIVGTGDDEQYFEAWSSLTMSKY